MTSSKKAFLIMLILTFSCINLFYTIENFLLHTFVEVIHFLVISNILLFIIICYFLIKNNHSIKISINYKFLLVSLISFFLIIIYKCCYYLLIITDYNTILIILLWIFFIIFIILAFIKNINKNITTCTTYFIILMPFLIFIQYIFLCIASFQSFGFNKVTNINRYEFVQFHYFSDEDIKSLPKEIPSDATNIYFYYYEDIFEHSYKSLILEFDSKSISEQRIEYHIIVNKYNE